MFTPGTYRAILILFLVLFNSALINAIRINEVELNPPGADSGNEWIELYSPQETNIDGWSIENSKGRNISLSGSFSYFKVITTPYNFLANNKQKLSLLNDINEKIDETNVISDASNDGRSWQFCGGWVFGDSSKEQENDCGTETAKEDNSNKTVVSTGQEKNSTPAVISSSQEREREKDTLTKEPIKLEPKDIKTWKSQEARIKEHALYGFALFCIVLFVILVWRRYGRKNKSDNDF